MMDDANKPRVLPEILARKSAKFFSHEMLPNDVIASLFEAARWAPSSGNGQPWRFVITRRGSEGHRKLSATLRDSNRWAASAPVLVLAAVRRDHVHPTKPSKPNRLALFELGWSVGNLVTQATLLDIATHPIAGFDANVAGDLMGMPEAYQSAVVIAMGRSANRGEFVDRLGVEVGQSRERIPLTDFVFEGCWDRAFKASVQKADAVGSGDPMGCEVG